MATSVTGQLASWYKYVILISALTFNHVFNFNDAFNFNYVFNFN